MEFQVTPELVSKILDTVDAGLIAGLGKAQPGNMCVEAAICYAMGLPHSDEPTCVGNLVQNLSTRLNDSDWSSDQARASGMRKLAVAQLGSNTISQTAFYDKVDFQNIKWLTSEMFKDMAKQYPDRAEVYLQHANACGQATNMEEAKEAAEPTYTAPSYANPALAAYPNYGYTSHPVSTSYYAAKATKTGDKYFILTAEIFLQSLKELNSPGCQFLYMCD